MKKELAIMLVSGGMDSCVTAAIANEQYRLAFLHVNYGQRTEARELRAFNEIADFYKPKRGSRSAWSISRSSAALALTDETIPVPETE